MEKSIVLSIIIPIYNREDCITKLLKTILEQEDTECELIIVDDGSTDKSYSICRDMCEYFLMPIKVLTKPNGGASSARNEGIKASNGKYICFVDSDDMIAGDYIASVKALCANGHDLYQINHKVGDEEKGYKEVQTELQYGEIDLRDYYRYVLAQKSNEPWSKIYSNHIIKENNLLFDTSLTIAEDISFTLKFLEFCNNCFISSISPYYYYLNPNGLCKSVKLEYLSNHNQLFFQMKNFIRDKKLSEEYYQTASNYILKSFFRIVGYLVEKGYTKAEIITALEGNEAYEEVLNTNGGLRKWLLEFRQFRIISMLVKLRARERR